MTSSLLLSRAFVAVALSMLTTACVTHDRYPANWPARVFEEVECPDLSGVYSNDGSGTDGILFCPECPEEADYRQCAKDCNDSTLQLTEVFFGRAVGDEQNVQIEPMGDGELAISLHPPVEAEATRMVLREGKDFECRRQRLWISLDESLEVDIGGVALSERRLGLVRAEDGSLIGEFYYEGAGVIFVAVPARWSEKHFVRWLPLGN